jgi:hypothetical protein
VTLAPEIASALERPNECDAHPGIVRLTRKHSVNSAVEWAMGSMIASFAPALGQIVDHGAGVIHA